MRQKKIIYITKYFLSFFLLYPAYVILLGRDSRNAKENAWNKRYLIARNYFQHKIWAFRCIKRKCCLTNDGRERRILDSLAVLRSIECPLGNFLRYVRDLFECGFGWYLSIFPFCFMIISYFAIDIQLFLAIWYSRTV